MSFRDEMKKIQSVKPKSDFVIKQEKLQKAYKILDQFLEREFENYEKYILDLVKKEIERKLRKGEYKSSMTKKGEVKKVYGKIYFCSDKYVDPDRNGKEIFRAPISSYEQTFAIDAIQPFGRNLGFNCVYNNVGLDISHLSIKKDIGIIFVKDGIYEKKLKEFFKTIKNEEEIDISFSSSKKTTLVDNETYYITDIKFKFVV